MSHQPPEHPFDAKDGPNVINYQGTKVAIRPSKPAPLNSQNVPLVRPQQGPNSTRREIDRMARQLEGMSKTLRQLREKV